MASKASNAKTHGKGAVNRAGVRGADDGAIGKRGVASKGTSNAPKSDAPSTRARSHKPVPPEHGGRRQTKIRKLGPNLDRVLRYLTYPELAAVCGISLQAVHQWREIPPMHALAVETATAGKVPKEKIAPKLYPPAARPRPPATDKAA
jgi:hypothetical protein